MPRFEFDLATPDDDAQLRRILAVTPMDGAMSVSLRREPSYFDAAVVEGPFHQTIVARDRSSGRIAAMGARGVRLRWVGGEPVAVGYLSGLRCLPEYRGSGVIPRGYRFFRQLHGDQRTSVYLTTIADRNTAAIRLLTSGRAGLPQYHDVGRYITVAIPIPSSRRAARSLPGKVTIRPAEPADMAGVLDFWNTVGPRRQFFPVYSTEDFFHSAATFRDLRPGDLLLAFRGQQLVGTLAGWDQTAFRQIVVERYCTALRWSRWAYNAWAAIRRQPRLPRPGRMFRWLTAALVVISEDDPSVFEALLDAALVRAAGHGWDCLLVGMHEADPLLACVRRRQAISYDTRCYVVCWSDGEAFRKRLDDRPLYLELGCL
ncbi:MAG: hypothetical protein KJ000_03870 [Pirellulaceae bacterium]|nr:hypothetical protein [Pirellulaceae bacterium]